MDSYHLFFIIIAAFPFLVATDSVDTSCVKMEAIYENGKDLCEKMWGDSFRYVDVDDDEYPFAYTMWFFTQKNPNDQVTASRRVNDTYGRSHDADYNTSSCHLRYHHKEKPSPEPDTFTECHPWKNNACCHNDTVASAEKLRVSYGKGYEWDRCGPLTPECERFFVQEACFYECDPNAGLYRKFRPSEFNASDDTHNEWQMHLMPIKGDYCDAWHTACRGENYFCGSGDFFECSHAIEEELAKNENSEKDKRKIMAFRNVIIIVSLFAFICIVAVLILICCEAKGKPLFHKLPDNVSSPALSA